ncbi:MAG: hypothetical protein K2X29_03240 [Candidatus Obscuribacterales bacterium]|nr:hypothetical protein [Candidatus Obscuribacterales bacterium]
MITEDDKQFLNSFEQCSLGAKCWTHAAHIRMAWLVLETSQCFEDAVSRIKSGIQRFNSSNNSIGYHETITLAFAAIIDSRRKEGQGFSDFADENPDLFAKDYLNDFYDPAILKTEQAKNAFVEPNKKPLPISVEHSVSFQR